MNYLITLNLRQKPGVKLTMVCYIVQVFGQCATVLIVRSIFQFSK